MKIGQKIREIRKSRNLTQKQLEARIVSEKKNNDYNGAYIRKYESGQRHPKPETIEKIANALGVCPEAIACAEINPTKAMHQLFRMFEEYGGQFMVVDDKVYLTLDELSDDLNEWFKWYNVLHTDSEDYMDFLNEYTVS